jgi:hypothetical protein
VTDAWQAAEEAIARGDDADDVLRGVVAALVSSGGCEWAGVLFVESGELVLGPAAGEPRPNARTHVPVTYGGERIAELAADGCTDVPVLERVAALISPYCLVGWDTGGEPWDPGA